MFDPRFLTGPAFFGIGLFLFVISIRLWVVHPVNRVFRLGRFVTEDGMTALLNARVVFLAYGLLGLTSGMTRCIYWFGSRQVYDPAVMFLGSLETGLAIWSALLSASVAFRIWRLK